MAKGFFKNYVLPVATLSGSIIGAGFLSLPYIAVQVGFWAMLAYLVVLTVLITALHVIFAQICLKTPDYKQWPGFVGFYFGSLAKKLALAFVILGSYGVLLAYVIIGGQFLQTLAGPYFGGSPLAYILVYFLVGITVVYFGVKTISKFEFFTLCLLFISLGIICFEAFGKIQAANIFLNVPVASLGIKTLFLPYGALMFSLWGIGLVPELEEMLAGNKKILKRVVIIGSLVPAFLYLIFTIMIMGISGGHTTESALTGLKLFLAPHIFSVAIFVGLLTTFTAFVTQGLFLKKTFMYDAGLKEFPAWTLTCLPPIALFFLGIDSFIPLISFVGGVLLSVDGILIMLMYKKIGGRAIIVYPFMAVFALGTVYELVYFFT